MSPAPRWDAQPRNTEGFVLDLGNIGQISTGESTVVFIADISQIQAVSIEPERTIERNFHGRD